LRTTASSRRSFAGDELAHIPNAQPIKDWWLIDVSNSHGRRLISRSTWGICRCGRRQQICFGRSSSHPGILSARHPGRRRSTG
jgi:hypothetical protein